MFTLSRGVENKSFRPSIYRDLGRLLCALTALGLVVIDWLRANLAVAIFVSPLPHEWPLQIMIMLLLGSLLGAGCKTVDLTQEHGLSRSMLPWGIIVTVMAYAGLTMFSAGMTIIVFELLYHGIIKGKADTRPLLMLAVAICGIILVGFWFQSAVRIDWFAVFLMLVSATVWSWFNNLHQQLGDHLWHQIRIDHLVLLAVLTIISPARWGFLAVLVVSQHLVYAMVKRLAMGFDWYTDGHEIVGPDNDWFGLAFHEKPRARKSD